MSTSALAPPGYVWLTVDGLRLHLVPSGPHTYTRMALCGYYPLSHSWMPGAAPPCPECVHRSAISTLDGVELECSQCERPFKGAHIRPVTAGRADDPARPVICSHECLDAWSEAQWETDYTSPSPRQEIPA